MTDTQTRIPLADGQSVETLWYSLLTDEGVDPADAEGIVRSLQTHPTFAFGNPDRETVEEAIEVAIDEIDLNEAGVNRAEATRSMMKEALTEGLWGDRPGPVSLAEDTTWDRPEDIDVADRLSESEQEDTAAAAQTSEATATDEGAKADEPPSASEAADKFTPDTEPTTGDQTGHLAETGPAGAQPAAQGQTAQSQGEIDGHATAPDTDPDTDEPEVDFSDIDVETIIANMVVRDVREEFDDIEWDDGKEDLVGLGAQSAVQRYQHELRDLLFPQLSGTQQQLGFEWLVEDRLRGQLAEGIRVTSGGDDEERDDGE